MEKLGEMTGIYIIEGKSFGSAVNLKYRGPWMTQSEMSDFWSAQVNLRVVRSDSIGLCAQGRGCLGLFSLCLPPFPQFILSNKKKSFKKILFG